MRLRELIEDLQDELNYWGDIEVRAANSLNSLITDTQVSRFAITDQMVLFLVMEE